MKSKGKVFLLDDEDLIVSVLAKSMKSEGYEVYPETETDGVIEKIKSWDPDVLLMDIRMPDRNGIDILEEIKDSKIDTQVVMLTADDTVETAVKAMKLGAADYLTKPFNTDEVKIVIGKIIKNQNLRQEVDYLRRAYSEVFEKDMIGESAALKVLEEKILKIARAQVSNILVTGESGSSSSRMQSGGFVRRSSMRFPTRVGRSDFRRNRPTCCTGSARPNRTSDRSCSARRRPKRSRSEWTCRSPT